MVNRSLKSTWKALCRTLKPPSATWAKCSKPVAAVIQLSPPGAAWHEASSGNCYLSSRRATSHPRCMGRSEACIHSAMLHSSETWGPNASNLQHLGCTNRSMNHWICGVNKHDEVPSDQLLLKLGLHDVTVILHSRRLRWFSHAQRANSCIKWITDFTAPCCRGCGQCRKTWEKCIHNNVDNLHLSEVEQQDRVTWWSVVCRSLIQPTPQWQKLVKSGRLQANQNMDKMWWWWWLLFVTCANFLLLQLALNTCTILNCHLSQNSPLLRSVTHKFLP